MIYDLIKEYDSKVIKYYLLLNNYNIANISKDELNKVEKEYNDLENTIIKLREEINKITYTTLEIVVDVEELKRNCIEIINNNFNTKDIIKYIKEAKELIDKELEQNKRPSRLLALDSFIKEFLEHILGLTI